MSFVDMTKDGTNDLIVGRDNGYEFCMKKHHPPPCPHVAPSLFLFAGSSLSLSLCPPLCLFVGR